MRLLIHISDALQCLQQPPNFMKLLKIVRQIEDIVTEV
jgi:hypothetical protein